ncbi:unnamed protein product, partial [Clonostachys byssicola]
QTPISWQEGAVMAASISTESFCGLLPGSDPSGIMRDLDEICITVAEYDKEYVDHITKGFKSAEMNSTQGSPTTFVQLGQKRSRGRRSREQRREERHGGDDEEGQEMRFYGPDHRRSLPEGDPSTVSLNRLEQQLKSASKLKFPDWLLLKALHVEEQNKPTPTNIFGEKVGTSLEEESLLHLQGEPWWPAVESSSIERAAWREMWLWKKAQLKVDRRTTNLLNKPSANGVDDSDDLDDIFETYTEPAEHHRSTAQRGQDKRRSDHAADKQTALDHGLTSSSEPGSADEGGSMASRNYSDEDMEDEASTNNAIGQGNDLAADPSWEPSSQKSGTDDGSTMSNDTRTLSDSPPDEVLVNTALGLLLDGITESHPDVDGKFEWTTFHRRFEVSQLKDRDNEEKREKVMAAKVDGCLQTIEPGKVEEHSDALCILEVKPVRRGAKRLSIAMQEAAEMAAWISSEHELGLLPSFRSDAAGSIRRRLLISQDLDEICITVAEFDDEYIEYISNKTPKALPNGQRGQKRQRGQQATREQGGDDEASEQEREEKQQKLEEDESRVRDNQHDDEPERDDDDSHDDEYNHDDDDEHYDDEHYDDEHHEDSEATDEYHEDSEATDEGTNEYAQHNNESDNNESDNNESDNDESDNALEDNGNNGLERSEATGKATSNGQGENDVPRSLDRKRRAPGFLTMRQFEPIRITEETIGDIMVLLLSVTLSLCREHERYVESKHIAH